ncbi:MAG: helix-turn-helix domain-containing protein [Phycisphaerales bacterium]|jgi:hypothetical protein|nr:helix-turn-helix domain-containing protein [Phycisphaerales bacterium]MBT7171330.1 helix-turn-helix domain-containing protein [Phycisphaerales bacterium]
MGKMYYTEQEACEKLGLDPAGLTEKVNAGQLQQYQDGAKHVYKAGDVDTLAESGTMSLVDDDDTLALAETVIMDPADADAISLAEVDDLDIGSGAIRKEDTVITTQGISIFDDEDLEIEEADPLAKTQIAPSLDDQIALDGVGSGSGLLDLTRESDDTSLGAEVLGNIDLEAAGSGLMGSGLMGSGLAGSGMGSGLDDSSAAFDAAAMAAVRPISTEPPIFVEPEDGATGLFGGLMFVTMLLMVLIVAVSLAAQQGVFSEITKFAHTKITLVLSIAFGGMLVASVVGLLIGRSIAAKRELAEKFAR